MIIEFIKAHISGIAKGRIVEVDQSFGERMIKEKYAEESNKEDLEVYNKISTEDLAKRAEDLGYTKKEEEELDELIKEEEKKKVKKKVTK